MLSHVSIRNFKRFEYIEVDLNNAVVFIGPNNCGKTSALQALALWELGVRRWTEKRGLNAPSAKRSGVALNRNDLLAIPIPTTNLLWRDLHVRSIKNPGARETKPQNIRIEIKVDGVTEDKIWSCGLEFDYANEESLYCRPLNSAEHGRIGVPPEATNIRVAFLPPMSGLAAIEPKWEPGRIKVLLGEGQTAQVLRNLCWQVYEKRTDDWAEITGLIQRYFGVELLPPEHIGERGEIRMAYREATGTRLDLSSAGRGLQQTLLLLTHLYANPQTVLLLDEPDAHLEILRQRHLYQMLTETAGRQSSQVIIASHSEVILNEAAGRDMVIAFVGQPHRLNDRGSQLLKSLRDISFDHYYQAEQTGWVLYLEGSTDLAVLQTLAKQLNHPAASLLERPFVHYVANQPQKARDHFFGLREAKKDLVGLALFDRLEKTVPTDSSLVELTWRRRELENYLCSEAVLLAYARHDQPFDLFGAAEANRREQTMREAINEMTAALKVLRKLEPWSPDVKASDDFLDRLFEIYFEKLQLPNLMRKTDYHVLARFVPADQIDPEITEKLDAIVAIAQKAQPCQ